MNRFTVVKVNDKLGYIDLSSSIFNIRIDQRTGERTEVRSLNKIILEDGTSVMKGDDELEVIDDDRSKEFIEQIEQLYSK